MATCGELYVRARSEGDTWRNDRPDGWSRVPFVQGTVASDCRSLTFCTIRRCFRWNYKRYTVYEKFKRGMSLFLKESKGRFLLLERQRDLSFKFLKFYLFYVELRFSLRIYFILYECASFLSSVKEFSYHL